MGLPKDPAMLLGFVNLKLRDFYPDLDKMCEDLGMDRKDIEDALGAIDYEYDADQNQFI